MSIAIILLLVGVISGLARGGSLEDIAKQEFRWPGLVFVGLFVQIGSEVAAATFYPPLGQGEMGLIALVVSYGALVAFVVRNRRLPGALIIGAGLMLNLVVIVANNGMPVSLPAAGAAGLPPTDYLERAVKHTEMGPGTILPFLGDVIPVPLLRTVVSIGDIVLGVGIFRLVERSISYSPRRRPGGEQRERRPSAGGTGSSPER